MRKCAICSLMKPDACFPHTSRCTQCEASHLGVGSRKRLKMATTQAPARVPSPDVILAREVARLELEHFRARGARVVGRPYVRHTNGGPVRKHAPPS